MNTIFVRFYNKFEPRAMLRNIFTFIKRKNIAVEKKKSQLR